MKFLTLLTAVFFVQIVVAQSENQSPEIDYNQEDVIKNFTTGYNYLSPKRIYNLLDDSVKQSQSMDDIDQYLEEYDKKIGMIEDYRVLEEKGNKKMYVIEGEKTYAIMKFEFSDDNKIKSYETQMLSNVIPNF